MTDAESLQTLEDRVRELQTAVATMVRHLGIEREVTAAERVRLDEIGVRGRFPTEHLSELYGRTGRG